MRRITFSDLSSVELSPKHAAFVVEYLKDMDHRRAAESLGLHPDTGYRYLEREDISTVISDVLQKRMEECQIDADWLLYEMVDNHTIARQTGNITASNTALNMIAKHKRVDAFAADKIKVSTDADVMDRLVAARRRLSQDDEDDSVSFM